MSQLYTALARLQVAALTSVSRVRQREEGQSLVEYALILGLIAAVVIGVLAALGTHISSLFSNVSTDL